MPKTNKRAIRRCHSNRLKKRTRFIVTKVWRWSTPINQKLIDDTVSRRWNNLQSCCCISCHNPRHGYRPSDTLAEIRNLYTLKEDVDSFLSGEDTINLSENNNEIQSYI